MEPTNPVFKLQTRDFADFLEGAILLDALPLLAGEGPPQEEDLGQLAVEEAAGEGRLGRVRVAPGSDPEIVRLLLPADYAQRAIWPSSRDLLAR